MLPDFLIIGTQRGGTTSLYRYLAEHPKVAPARQKEIHYFSVNYGKGLDWYLSFFPPRRGPRRRVTGEASPYYLFHPHTPARVARDCPDAKIVVLLRDPVARAFSHHRHEVKLGEETLAFEEAVAAEDERIAPDLVRMAGDPLYEGHSHRHHSYLARGRYAEQLDRWMEVIEPERMLVLRSEDLFERPADVYARTVEFLGLPPHDLDVYTRHNASEDTAGLSDATRRELAERFRPHNERLYAMLDRDMGWG